MKTLLLVTAAALLLVATPTFAKGYWTFEHVQKRGRSSCYAYTKMNNGALLGIGINNEDRALYTFIIKPTWDIPPHQDINIDVSVDDSESVTAPGYADIDNSREVVIPVKPEYVRLFVHMVTAGDNLHIRFHGSEPDWNVSLWGSSDAYDKFFDCTKRVVPEWAHRYRPRPPEETQPYYNKNTNTQPYGRSD
jgi:hypothetical protein